MSDCAIRGRGRGRGYREKEFTSSCSYLINQDMVNRSQELSLECHPQASKSNPQQLQVLSMPESITTQHLSAPPRETIQMFDCLKSIGSELKIFPPSRPKLNGTTGKPINLRLNCFPITLPNISIHIYRAEVYEASSLYSDVPIRAITLKYVCSSVMQALFNAFSSDFKNEIPVYDGQGTLYTKHRLWDGNPIKEYLVEWKDLENGARLRTQRVIIEYLSMLDLSVLQGYLNKNILWPTDKARREAFSKSQALVKVIQVLCKQLPASRHTLIGRCFYLRPVNLVSDFENGCELWEGYSQSIRPGQWKLFVNIDTCSSAMMAPVDLLDFICDVAGAMDFDYIFRNPSIKSNVQKVLSTLKIQTHHQGHARIYKITSDPKNVFGNSASEHTFKQSDGSVISTETYFFQKYQIKLKFPRFPLIMVGTKGTALPAELCKISKGQLSKQHLTVEQKLKMIEHAAKPADTRMQEIEEIALKEYAIHNNPILQHYGIEMDPNMIEVIGRVLDAPKIEYDNLKLYPRDGSWNLQGVKFAASKTLTRWGIIDFIFITEETLTGFLNELFQVGKNCGMNIISPLFVRRPHIDSRDDAFRKVTILENELRNIHQSYQNLQLMMFLIHEKPSPMINRDLYGHIKRICDSELGILSQCIRDKNVFNPKKSTVANICLKINAKLGGINHLVDMSRSPFNIFFQRPIMFIGADVNHPDAGKSSFSPSIAAVVCSLDAKLAKYASSVRFQKHTRASSDLHIAKAKRKERIEIISQFEDMSFELLTAFRNICKGNLPERIIYYRDGVSEGQFRHVLNHELLALRNACLRFRTEKPGYEPSVTIICVQKRHHLRMFCKNLADSVGRSHNVPPGTIVDHEVTHPIEFDFYLCSHFSFKGTSRPIHYHVLWDENHFDANSLQELTYQLCHTYARCTKTVSIPAPVYYSHWVAKRASMSHSFIEDSAQTFCEVDNWDQKRNPIKVETGLMYWA